MHTICPFCARHIALIPHDVGVQTTLGVVVSGVGASVMGGMAIGGGLASPSPPFGGPPGGFHVLHSCVDLAPGFFIICINISFTEVNVRSKNFDMPYEKRGITKFVGIGNIVEWKCGITIC